MLPLKTDCLKQPEIPLQRFKCMIVLFICTGNTCRSPIAEAVYNHYSTNLEENYAFSRGTSVFMPQSINPKSAYVLEKHGIDFNLDFCSCQLSTKDMEKADIILTMTSEQKLLLKNAFPNYKFKIYSLCEKAYGKDGDIDDPFGGSIEIYMHTCDEILKAVKNIYEQNYQH